MISTLIKWLLLILYKAPRYIRAVQVLVDGIERARADGKITVNEAAQIIVDCLNVVGLNDVVLHQSKEPLEPKE